MTSNLCVLCVLSRQLSSFGLISSGLVEMREFRAVGRLFLFFLKA